MDTLEHPHAAGLPGGIGFSIRPALSALRARLTTAWHRFGMTGPERFLADANDLAHLERRLRALERDGWPPR